MARTGQRLNKLRGTVLLMLALAALACSAPPLRGNVTLTPTETSTPLFAIDPTLLTPEAPQPGEATNTPEPNVTPSPTIECTYWATFVKDVTIPDGTEIPAGSTFEKTWEIWNSGCLDWPAGTQLILMRGDRMGNTEAFPVLPTAANTNTNVTITLTAPGTPGEYISYWRFRAPSGVIFGEEIYVQIKVIPADTPTPTATSTATPAWMPFVGTWVNQNSAERISRIEISAAGDVISAHLWQTCVPSACDLGIATTSAADASDGVLSFTWTRDTVTETQRIAILHDGRLWVQGEISGGESYEAYFTRQE